MTLYVQSFSHGWKWYDLTTSSDLKLQYDNQRDQSGPNWSPNYGDAKLLTFTYDMVF